MSRFNVVATPVHSDRAHLPISSVPGVIQYVAVAFFRLRYLAPFGVCAFLNATGALQTSALRGDATGQQ